MTLGVSLAMVVLSATGTMNEGVWTGEFDTGYLSVDELGEELAPNLAADFISRELGLSGIDVEITDAALRPFGLTVYGAQMVHDTRVRDGEFSFLVEPDGFIRLFSGRLRALEGVPAPLNREETIVRRALAAVGRNTKGRALRRAIRNQRR